jgi:hypothetical protein
MSLETTQPSERREVFPEHDLSKIIPELGRITSQEFTTSDVDRSFFIDTEPPRAKINGHGISLPVNFRTGLHIGVSKSGEIEVPQMNSADVRGQLEAHLELRRSLFANRRTNGKEVPEPRLFSLVSALEDGAHYDNLNLIGLTRAEDRYSRLPDTALFEQHCDSSQNTAPSTLVIPINAIWSLRPAAPINWESTPAAQHEKQKLLQNLADGLVQIKRSI